MQYINLVKVRVKLNYNNKAIFLDRDGVINNLVLRDGKLYSPRYFQDFRLYNDVKESIHFFKKNYFHIIIISNQPDISRGNMDINELNKIDEFLNKNLEIDEINYSFDSQVVNGGSKKPSPKMIFDAQKKWKIDLSKSYFIGDSLVDIECAKNANVPFILIKRKHNQDLIYPDSIESLNDIKTFIS